MTKKNLNHRIELLISESKYYLLLILRDFTLFFSILFRPITLIVFTLTILILIIAQSSQSETRLVFEIAAAITSGVFGGMITDKIIESMGNTFLIKKSNSAIRNLQLIKFKITNINERIYQLEDEENGRDFSEIENLVTNIHRDIINSINDWSDVNPKSGELTDYYEMLTVKQNEIKKLTQEKKILEQQKSKVAESKKEETARLTEEIKSKNDEINELNKQLDKLNDKGNLLSGSFLSSSSVSYPGTVVGDISTANICSRCGNFYSPGTSLSGVLQDIGVCNNCKQRGI